MKACSSVVQFGTADLVLSSDFSDDDHHEDYHQDDFHIDDFIHLPAGEDPFGFDQPFPVQPATPQPAPAEERRSRDSSTPEDAFIANVPSWSLSVPPPGRSTLSFGQVDSAASKRAAEDVKLSPRRGSPRSSLSKSDTPEWEDSPSPKKKARTSTSPRSPQLAPVAFVPHLPASVHLNQHGRDAVSFGTVGAFPTLWEDDPHGTRNWMPPQVEDTPWAVEANGSYPAASVPDVDMPMPSSRDLGREILAGCSHEDIAPVQELRSTLPVDDPDAKFDEIEDELMKLRMDSEPPSDSYGSLDGTPHSDVLYGQSTTCLAHHSSRILTLCRYSSFRSQPSFVPFRAPLQYACGCSPLHPFSTYGYIAPVQSGHIGPIDNPPSTVPQGPKSSRTPPLCPHRNQRTVRERSIWIAARILSSP